MILLILNTLAQNLVQKKYVKKRPRRAASRGFSCEPDPIQRRRRASTT